MKGWSYKKISEIGKVQTGYTPQTSDKENYGNHIPFIKPGDFFKDGSLNYENQGLSERGLKKVRLVAENSVLMVCIGATIGKVGFTEQEVSTNQQINALTPVYGDNAKFIFYQMLIQDFQAKVLNGAGQATLPIINKKNGAIYLYIFRILLSRSGLWRYWMRHLRGLIARSPTPKRTSPTPANSLKAT
jgi:type I restriction enzyme S subunit